MTASGFIAVIAAYLLGSMPWSYLVVRVHRGIDLRTIGSRSAGATNVMRASGKWAALLALALDVAKGTAALFVAFALEVGPWWLAAAAVAAVAGHVFPIFLGFRGGKGVATAAGALIPLVPGALLGALVVFVALVVATRYVSLGSVAASASLPGIVGLSWWLGGSGESGGSAPAASLFVGTLLIATLVISKHRANLRRLRAGTESRLGSKPPSPPAEAGG